MQVTKDPLSNCMGKKSIFYSLGSPIAAIYYWSLELNMSLAAEYSWEQADKIFV